MVHLCQDGLPHHQRQESRPRQGLWGEKLAFGTMCDGFDEGQAEEWDDDEGDFLAEQGEEGVLQRLPPQVGLLYLVENSLNISKSSIQVCGQEPQGDGEAGGRRQGVGLHRGEEECERVSFSCSSSQEGGELPADWHPGEETLPFNLEAKKIFLGLEDNQQDKGKGRATTIDEPKVKDQLITHLLRWKPRFWT